MAESKAVAAITAVSGVVAILVGITQLTDWFKKEVPQSSVVEEPTATAAQTTIPAETTVPAESAAGMTTAETTGTVVSEKMAAISTGSETETTASAADTTASSVQTTAEPLQLDDTVKADSAFKVKDICRVTWNGNSAGDFPQFFDFDAKTGTLYVQSDLYALDAYDIQTREKCNIVDFSQQGDKGLGGISVNPFSGKLYAMIQSKDTIGNIFYDITDDQQISTIHTSWSYPNGAEGMFNSLSHLIDFRDENSFILFDERNNSWPCYAEYALKDGKCLAQVRWYPKPKEVDVETEFIKPFLWKDCYYYVCKSEPYAGSGSTFVAKTVRLNAEECKQKIMVYQGDEQDAPGLCVMQDAFCYIDKNNNIYLFNPDGERSGGGLLSDGKNQDVLLVDGNKIEETATGHLSNKIPLFLRIDNSHFVMFDASDSTLKYLYSE